MNLEGIRNIAVLGSGTMGHGIAQIFLMGGYPVTMFDIEQSILNTAKTALKPYNFLMVKRMEKIFDGKKVAKLGTPKNPAHVSVQTEERAKELESVFKKKGWEYTIELEPDKPEDITDFDLLMNPPKTKIAEKKVGRNEPCPCGSGKKYKKCCGK